MRILFKLLSAARHGELSVEPMRLERFSQPAQITTQYGDMWAAETDTRIPRTSNRGKRIHALGLRSRPRRTPKSNPIHHPNALKMFVLVWENVHEFRRS